MKRRKSKFLLSALLLISLGAAYAQDFELPAPGDKPFIYFSADDMEYLSDEEILRLVGNVVLIAEENEQNSVVITTQNVTLKQKTSEISTEGKVTVDSPKGSLEGYNLEANYKTSDFKIEQVKADFPPIRVLESKSVENKKGQQKYKGVKLTCCEEEEPHYSVKAGTMTMTPEKKIFVFNALLYLQDIPVFYLPVFWRSLDSKKPFTTYVDFTQSSKTGFALLTSTVFEPIKDLKAIANVDYYTKSGLGFGAQATIINQENIKANFESYFIKDENQDKSRWGINGGLYWIMKDTSDSLAHSGAIYQSQAQFRSVSDPYFNDSFFRNNPYAFMPDQDISFSLSRQSKYGILRGSYKEKNEYDYNQEKYSMAQRTLPEISYQLMPFTLKGTGIVSNFNVSFKNEEKAGEIYKQSANFKWVSARAFKLNRAQTFTPHVFFDERVTFNNTDYDKKDAWVSRVGGGANLRTSLFTGDLDISYNYTKRLSTSSLTSDSVSDDRGEEENGFYIQNYFMPTNYTYLRLRTGYSIRDDDNSWDTDERLEPLLAELGINSPGNDINLFARNLYDFVDGNQSFIMSSNFRVKNNHRLSLGMTNYYDTINMYTFQTRVLLMPLSQSWSVDAWGDFTVEHSKFHMFSKGLRVYKTFHDAAMMFTVEDRNNNLSFGFRINIICGPQKRSQTFSRDYEYWNPWRQPGDLRG
ncbi:LPS-assembly protein [Parelusimicrobium proximum]|uniref:LPS export ABC transporter periplasmic protein LptC n=1 Tax=Parelusimicrobium proximum TaxID=3228953 RepID=UPI003D178D9A